MSFFPPPPAMMTKRRRIIRRRVLTVVGNGSEEHELSCVYDAFGAEIIIASVDNGDEEEAEENRNLVCTMSQGLKVCYFILFFNMFFVEWWQTSVVCFVFCIVSSWLYFVLLFLTHDTPLLLFCFEIIFLFSYYVIEKIVICTRHLHAFWGHTRTNKNRSLPTCPCLKLPFKNGI